MFYSSQRYAQMTDEPLWGGFLGRKKKHCMSVSVRTHAGRNALNVPEDAFNDGYKLSIFPTDRHSHLLWAQKPPVTTKEVFAE